MRDAGGVDRARARHGVHGGAVDEEGERVRLPVNLRKGSGWDVRGR